MAAIALGLAVVGLCTILASLLVASDDLLRRREWVGLRSVGISRSQLLATHAYSSLVTGVSAAVVSGVAGTVVLTAFLQVADVPVDGGLLLAVGAVCVLTSVAASTLVGFLTSTSGRV